jgi:hypothetical protein
VCPCPCTTPAHSWLAEPLIRLAFILYLHVYTQQLVGCVQSLSFSEGLQIEGLTGGYKEVAGGLGWIGLRIPTPWERRRSSSFPDTLLSGNDTETGGTAAVRRRRMMQEEELAWSAVGSAAAAEAAADRGRQELGPAPNHKVTFFHPLLISFIRIPCFNANETCVAIFGALDVLLCFCFCVLDAAPL